MLLSIIIPTCNRAELLKNTLYSITKLVRLESAEILIIDNGSSDNTKQVVESFRTNIPNLNYIYDGMPGLLTGRHRGMKEANGEILIFLDDDVEVCPGYLQGVSEVFSDPEVRLATGPSLPKFDVYPPYWLEYFWSSHSGGGRLCGWLSLLDLGSEALLVDPNLAWGLNFVIRKNILLQLNGFHPDCMPTHLQQFQGDGESGLTQKLAASGYKAFYHPKIMLYHKVSEDRLTEEYFIKRAFYQGVCNSFTELRKEQLPGAPANIRADRNIKSVLRPYYHQIKNLIPKKKAAEGPEEIKEMFSRLKTAETEGYNFHQDQFRNNSRVKDWVLKKDYSDYNLPI